MADHINVMHLGRQAFIECESDRVQKTALKKRVYAREENISPGDWVYYKNKSKRWEGPIKITTRSGKLLYAVRGGRLLTINTDHAVLVKSSDGEVLSRVTVEPGIEDTVGLDKNKEDENFHEETFSPAGQPAATVGHDDQIAVEHLNVQEVVDVDNEQLGELSQSEVLLPRDVEGSLPREAVVERLEETLDDAGSLDSPPTREESFPRTGADIGERQGPSEVLHNTGEVFIPYENISNSAVSSVTGEPMEPEAAALEDSHTNNDITYKDIKRKTTIKFKQPGDSEWTKGQVLSRAGKATSKYQHYWNITNVENNHTQPMNTQLFESIEKVPEEERDQNEEEERCFVVNIPRWRHGDRKCREAKQVEFQKFAEFAVYEEVMDEKQDRLRTMWC